MAPACWCGRVHAEERFRTASYRLLRCPDCGTDRIDPPPVEPGGEGGFYADYYAVGDGDEAPTIPSGRRSRFGRVVAQVPALARPRERVLDVGCGDGSLCRELVASGWPSVTGVDPSPVRIARARAAVPQAMFVVGTAGDVPAERGPFDLVVLDNVIEHITAPVDALRALRAQLADDGTLVLITPNLESGHFRLLGRRWTPELAPHTHVFLYTPGSLQRLVEAAGFTIDTTGSFHLPLPPFSTWRRHWTDDRAKGVAWCAMQEAGGLYGRLIRRGPMVYVVARLARP